MQEQSNTMTPTELMEKLGVIAALVFEIGVEEDDDEICAFRDVISIIGKARELPGEDVEKALADMDSLFEVIRSTPQGKEDGVIGGNRVWALENDAGHIIQALVDTCEWVNEPDEWHRVDGLINYLEDFWDLKSPASD